MLPDVPTPWPYAAGIENSKQNKNTKTPVSSFDFIEPPEPPQDICEQAQALFARDQLPAETMEAPTRASVIQNFDSPYHILETNVKGDCRIVELVTLYYFSNRGVALSAWREANGR
jgi:hypothetical protein